MEVKTGLTYDPERAIDWDRHAKTYRDRVVKSPVDWGAAYLPRHCLTPPAQCHYVLAQDALDNPKLVAAVARDHAKSTLFNVVLVLFETLNGRKNRPLLLQRTESAAGKWLIRVGREITDNPLLAKLYSITPRSPWMEKEEINFDVGGRSVTILARPIGGEVLGEHPDRLVFDDPQDIKQCRSASLCRDLDEWWRQTAIGARRKDTQIVLDGTLVHPDSLVSLYAGNGRDRAPRDGWLARIFSCVRKGSLDDSDCEVLWPERCPRDFLRDQQREMGPILFGRDYLMQDVPDSEAWFPIATLRAQSCLVDPVQPRARPRDLLIVMAVDPASTTSDTADETAIVAVGLYRSGERKGKFVWLDAEHGRWDPNQRIARTLAFYQRWLPSYLLPESNRAEDLLAAVEREAARAGMGRLPIRPIRQEISIPKEDRIESIVPYVSRGDLLVTTAVPESALMKFCAYPACRGDDVPDVMATAIRWLVENESGVPMPHEGPVYELQPSDVFGPQEPVRMGGDRNSETFIDLDKLNPLDSEADRNVTERWPG